VDDRLWKNLSLALGVVCAILIGVAGVMMVYGNEKTTTTPSGSPTGAIANGTEGPTASGTGGSGSPTVTKTPSSTGPASPAQITFSDMKLDSYNATVNGTGAGRTFSFVTDGAGPVTWAVTKVSAQGTVRMCAKVDQGDFTCKVGGVMASKGAMSDSTPDKPSTWTVVYYGYGDSTPTIDLSLTWPTTDPKVTLNHGRFQGSTTEGVSESLNGFSVTFKPRKAGSLNVQASWTVVTADVKVDLLDATTSPAVPVDSKAYSGVNYLNPPYVANVDPSKTYLVKVRDQSADSQRPDLTAVVQFP
jgi:hypothetical protein